MHKDVQIVTRSGRVAQPPPVDRLFAGTDTRDEIQREDYEILCQLRTTQARTSIWSLLASSSTHRDALIRALNQIRVDTTTTPGGLIHFLTADKVTCIVFSDDDLPPEGSDHVCHAPIPDLTRLANPNRVRGARTYTGTLYLLNQTVIYPSLIIYQHIIYKSPK